MKNFILAFFVVILIAATAFAQPKVVVLPFDPVMDSVYDVYSGKQSVLDYRSALQQMITTELGKQVDLRVVELSVLEKNLSDSKLSPTRWNDPVLASHIGSALAADYAVIGTYGEYTKQIRVDARVAVVGSNEVPLGNSVTATADLWEDLPSAASRIVEQLIPILTTSGQNRPVSKGYLYPEGDLASFDVTGNLPHESARLIIWVNTPAPEISLTPDAKLTRCERVDLLNASAEKQRHNSCKVASLAAGTVHVQISQRGFLPFDDEFSLAAGKVYRLEVNLIEVKPEVR